MDCKYAYLKRGIPYLLCQMEPEPTGYDKTSLFHAVCPHQAHCPKENCHKNTPGWERCAKLARKPQEAAQQPFAGAVQTEPEAEKPRQRSRKRANSAE